MNNTLPFSDTENRKLQFKVFPTLRLNDTKGDVGEINTVTDESTNKDIGEAKIIAKETVTIDGLSEQFLLFDTDSEGWDEAYESLCSHYDEAIGPNEDLTLYWSMWVDKYE